MKFDIFKNDELVKLIITIIYFNQQHRKRQKNY